MPWRNVDPSILIKEKGNGPVWPRPWKCEVECWKDIGKHACLHSGPRNYTKWYVLPALCEMRVNEVNTAAKYGRNLIFEYGGHG